MALGSSGLVTLLLLALRGHSYKTLLEKLARLAALRPASEGGRYNWRAPI